MLTDPTFWRDLGERAVRQVVQVLLPVLTIAITSGAISGLDYTDLAVTAGMAAAVTLLRALTGIRAPAGASFAVDALDRALAAAAGTALGLVTADGFDLLHADYVGFLGAVIGSAALAVFARFTNTPQPAPTVEPAGDAPVIYDYTDEVDTTGDGAA